MRCNHLLFPAVSLLGALLAVAAPVSTATAKTCFYDALCNGFYSNQVKQLISEGQNSDSPLLGNMAQSQDCRSIMTLHGFLTRAQFECGFNSYSDAMIQKARACAKSLTESETMKLLASGMKAFDREERDRGRTRICRDVLRDFPGIIRK